MKQYFYRLCMVTGLLCMCASVNAQSYSFSQSTATYTALSGAKVIPFTDFDPQSDLYWVDELIGETFYFYGRPFKLDTSAKFFFIQAGGDLRIDNDSALAIIDGAFTYLDSIDAQSSVSYKIEGVSGNKILKVQWKNLKVRVGQIGNYLNMQIWVYQQSGVVEIRYGPRSSNNASGFNINTGPQVGMFFSPFSFSGCYEKLWVNGSPTAFTLDSNANYVFKAMSGIPAEGTVYRFSPRFLVGTKELKGKSEYFMYPNPVKNELYFSENGNYEVYDITGRLMLHKYDVKQLDVSSLAPGIYFITDSTGRRAKIVKE